jgi:SAM-dependent methyltransferase
MHLTGIFPHNIEQDIPAGPVDLVQCEDCELVQMKQTYSLEEMYGDNYGYRSGLNATMVEHLKNNMTYIQNMTSLKPNDIILDIGSNDGTSLNFLAGKNYQLIGIDPSSDKFREFYHSDINLVSDFFNEENFKKIFDDQKAKIVTSFSMFYDLEDPLQFVQHIFNILADDGVWLTEQSYLPSMLKTNSFDTICQEHLEYYSLKQIDWIAKKLGLKILDINLNDINGGSFQVLLAKSTSSFPAKHLKIEALRKNEELFFRKDPFQEFISAVNQAKDDLIELLNRLKSENKKVFALGASTKGNVLLQYFGINTDLIQYVGEVNPNKFNCFTPGTKIPIISENKLLEMQPDYLLVLPWHFKDFFLTNKNFKGIKLIFPLPGLQVIEID